MEAEFTSPLLLPRLAAQARRRHADVLQASPAGWRSDVDDAARRALLDWTGVCLGARQEAQARITALTARGWSSAGRASLLTGGTAAPMVAAWVNATLSHVLDYDDTHVDSILHGSGPVWAALLALGQQHDIAEQRLLAAFSVGVQAGARLGMKGLGEQLTRHGWHATPVLGPIAAALAGALALDLPDVQVAHAMSLAATQAGGLTASFGAMAKPLHAGGAARHAVTAVELAARGCEGSLSILDRPGGLFQTLLQDPALDVGNCTLEGEWEVTRNSFKPYASCQLTHASIDAARALASRIAPSGIARVVVHAHPLALKVAGRAQPSNSNEAKFSLPFCVALGLSGGKAGASEFLPARIRDASLQTLASRVSLQADETATRSSARIEIQPLQGAVLEHAVASCYGSVDHPMRWDDLRAKFLDLARPVLAGRAEALADELSRFGEPGSLARITHTFHSAGDLA